MNVAPKTLKLMAVAGTVTVSVGAWYAAEKAIAYDLETQKSLHDESHTPRPPSKIVELGNEVLSVWYWAGTATGLITPPPRNCGICGMG